MQLPILADPTKETAATLIYKTALKNEQEQTDDDAQFRRFCIYYASDVNGGTYECYSYEKQISVTNDAHYLVDIITGKSPCNTAEAQELLRKYAVKKLQESENADYAARDLQVDPVIILFIFNHIQADIINHLAHYA